MLFRSVERSHVCRRQRDPTPRVFFVASVRRGGVCRRHGQTGRSVSLCERRPVRGVVQHARVFFGSSSCAFRAWRHRSVDLSRCRQRGHQRALECVGVGAGRVVLVFFFRGPATTGIYALSLHDAIPISKISADVGCMKKSEISENYVGNGASRDSNKLDCKTSISTIISRG